MGSRLTTAAETRQNVDLHLAASVSGDALEIHYSLFNRGSQNLVAYDGAGGTGDREHLDLTDQCYVSSAGQGLVRILRVRPAGHPTKNTTFIRIPAVSEVRPGEKRRVQFYLRLPLKERSEFSPDFPGAAYQKSNGSRLELTVGYFWKTADTKLKPLGHPNVFQVLRGAALSDIHEVTAATVVSFDLLTRTDEAFVRM